MPRTLATDGILISTTQFVPQIVREDYGYAATIAGLVLVPGGLVTVTTMFIAGRISAFVQPKWMIATGAALIAIGMYHLTFLYAGSTYWFFAGSHIWIGAGLPLVFLSLTAASYVGIGPRPDRPGLGADQHGEECRRLDRSVHRAERARPSRAVPSVAAGRACRSVEPGLPTHAPAGDGLLRGARRGRGRRALAWISRQVTEQSSFWAYIDVFWTLGIMAAGMIPLAMILKNVKLGGGAPATR